MNANDPFGDYIDDDKTIIRPNPGGRRAKSVESPTFTPPPLGAPTPSELPLPLREHLAQTSNNPLTGCAIALLSLSAQLRNSVFHADVAGLRNSVINEIKRFEINLRQHNVAPEQVQASRYALCTLLDEAVLNTPWGGNSLWATQSLLITFHKEAYGGEKFFLILKNSMQQPAVHLHLLELLYFCLCLGFEGKYRIQDHGASQLEDVRENLYQLIQRQRGDSERELSMHWRGIQDQRHVLAKWLPLWVITAMGALTVMLIFMGFFYAINIASSPLLSKLYGIKDNVNVPIVVANAAEPITPVNEAAFVELQGFMEPEVRKGEVSVEQKNGQTIVRILSNDLFASGSDKLSTQYYPLIDKISSALSKISGRIVVSGHTDNVPIRSVRFPSGNWDLSKARARSVVALLSQNPQLKAMMIAEGRADTVPLIDNDTPEHRAMNRRVDIIF